MPLFSLRKFIFYTPLILFLLDNIFVAFYWLENGASFQEYPEPSKSSSQHQWTLAALTNNNKRKEYSCKSPLVEIKNQERSSQQTNDTSQIPPFIHQTSKSRCVTPRFVEAIRNWQTWPNWSYYFHDDDAVARLFQQSVHYFPLLADIHPHCLLHGTLRADLWRYLVLWEYGGIYADMDAVPASFTPEWLEGQDAFFVIEQYHLLSQYFIAVTPKHPLLWYAIQVSLSNLWKLSDTGAVAAAITTGPHALHQAFILFAKDGGLTIEPARPGLKPVKAGTYVGTQGRSVTAVGVAEQQNEIINRDILGNFKKLEYSKLHMTFHQDDKNKASGKACFSAIHASKFNSNVL